MQAGLQGRTALSALEFDPCLERRADYMESERDKPDVPLISLRKARDIGWLVFSSCFLQVLIVDQ